MGLKQEFPKNNQIDANLQYLLEQNIKKHNQLVEHLEAENRALNARIDNLIIRAGRDNPNQVIDACVSAEGYEHETLKSRLDAEYNQTKANLATTNETVLLFGNKLTEYRAKLDELYGNKNRSISIYVSPSGNDKTGNGSENKPYKTIQRAVDEIPLINTAAYYIECEKGRYLENVVVRGIKNGVVEIRSKNFKSLPQYPSDTGVYVRSISFDACDGYVAVRGITQTDTSVGKMISFTRCDYAVTSKCAITQSTRGKDYKAIIYETSGGQIYDNKIENQHIVLSAEFNALMTLAWANEGLNNEIMISSSRSIVFNNNDKVKGENKTELGGQIF